MPGACTEKKNHITTRIPANDVNQQPQPVPHHNPNYDYVVQFYTSLALYRGLRGYHCFPSNGAQKINIKVKEKVRTDEAQR